MLLNAYALPKFADPAELAGETVVVIDVLRATTSIIHALEAGAREVLPCGEVEAARMLARQFPPGQAVLGGERHGRPIEGFDLGNSPEEFTPDRVAGKTVIFTTTNGTRAMEHVRGAGSVLIAGFVNASAVAKRLMELPRIHIVCAGTDGQPSGDDVLLAGMLIERVERLGGMAYQLNAQAVTAREHWLHRFALPQAVGAETLEPEQLAEALYDTPGGRNLAELGLDEDILAAAQIDRFPSVPELDPPTFRIRRPSP